MMLRFFLLLSMLFLNLPALADAQAQAALHEILQREKVDIVHAKALPDGTVEILFGIDASEAEQARLIEALRAHPHVRGVEASASSRTFCRIE